MRKVMILARVALPVTGRAVIGLERLSALVYPQEPKRDLAADVRAFDRSCTPIDPADTQLAARR
jgi:hypothetical protein